MLYAKGHGAEGVTSNANGEDWTTNNPSPASVVLITRTWGYTKGIPISLNVAPEGPRPPDTHILSETKNFHVSPSGR